MLWLNWLSKKKIRFSFFQKHILFPTSSFFISSQKMEAYPPNKYYTPPTTSSSSALTFLHIFPCYFDCFSRSRVNEFVYLKNMKIRNSLPLIVSGLLLVGVVLFSGDRIGFCWCFNFDQFGGVNRKRRCLALSPEVHFVEVVGEEAVELPIYLHTNERLFHSLRFNKLKL